MKTKILTFYECEYCGYMTDDEERVKHHEESCGFNETNRHCFTCDLAEFQWSNRRQDIFLTCKLEKYKSEYCDGIKYIKSEDKELLKQIEQEYKPSHSESLSNYL